MVTAESEDEEIMGIRHVSLPIEGVQFHPESIASEAGEKLIQNFFKPAPPKSILKTSLAKLHCREGLSRKEAKEVMEEIARGGADPVLVGAILTALGMKGETSEEIAGFAQVVRNRAAVVRRPPSRVVVDTCGTGGDKSGTFNISTVSALVVAGTDVCVAKHGQSIHYFPMRQRRPLGTIGSQSRCLPLCYGKSPRRSWNRLSLCPSLHGIMKHVVGVRKLLQIRTVFNILGPLSNPSRADRQVMGIFDPGLTETVARVMPYLGIKRGLVVSGEDGIDEITLTGKTRIAECRDGEVKMYDFSPEEVGLKRCGIADIRGGDSKVNADICLDILSGSPGPRRDVVILNAAAALYVSQDFPSFREGIEQATRSLDSGAARKKLDHLIRITRQGKNIE